MIVTTSHFLPPELWSVDFPAYKRHLSAKKAAITRRQRYKSNYVGSDAEARWLRKVEEVRQRDITRREG